MRNDYDRFTSAGGDIAAVTMGNVPQTAAFKDRYRLPFPCLADPERTAYQAFKVQRGRLRDYAGLSVWMPGLKSVARAGIGKPVGDVRQLQAGFVVDTAGVLRLIHYPENSADNLANRNVIEIIASIVARREE